MNHKRVNKIRVNEGWMTLLKGESKKGESVKGEWRVNLIRVTQNDQ